jgi:hypothetical protein
MNRDRQSSSNDPSSETTAAQSTPSATGVPTDRDGPGVERNVTYDEDAVNRTRANNTPRRYEQPLEDDQERVMPSDDSTKNTKI